MSERSITPNNHETNCRHSTKHIQLHYFTVVHHPGWNEIIASQGRKTCHQSGWIMGIWTKKDLILCKMFPNIVYIYIYIYTGWWFQIFFIFTPTWGNDPIWQFFFTTNQYIYIYMYVDLPLYLDGFSRRQRTDMFFWVEKIWSAKNRIYLEPPKTTTLKWMDGWKWWFPTISYMSNEKNLGWLGYIGDYTTQFYRDHNKPL